MSFVNDKYEENVVDAIMSQMSASKSLEISAESIKIHGYMSNESIDIDEQVIVNKNLILTHSPFLRRIFSSIDEKRDFCDLILPDFPHSALKGAMEVLAMSWCSKKEIFVDRNILSCLKLLQCDLGEIVKPVENKIDFEAECPYSPCYHKEKGSKQKIKSNLLKHVVKQHKGPLKKKIENKCFPPHSKARGFLCKVCKKSFHNASPDFRENHALTHLNSKEFPQLKDIQKQIEKIRFTEVITKKVKENNVAKHNETLHKVRKISSYMIKPHLNKSVNRSFVKITKVKKPKKTVKSKKVSDHNKSLFRRKKTKCNKSNLQKSDINGNSQTSLLLESLLEVDLPSELDANVNLDESCEELECSIIENEVSKYRSKIMKNTKIRKNQNVLDQLNLSDDADDFV